MNTRDTDPWNDEDPDENDGGTLHEFSFADLDVFATDHCAEPDSPGVRSWSDDATDEPADTQVDALLFTVANPADSVSATALIGGQIYRIDLSPQVESMTEAELSDEILFIASLASQQALAGQHLLVSAHMTSMGSDRVATQSFLEHSLRLPTPEAVLATKARVFADRYLDQDD
ncbi:MAG: YbaB/EbfC family DNA-binding protein [Mycolicibacterium neoaurum]|uniref:YbaB/EbfC family DNA-binding protein n=1 Tax=Mycolicibacterium neoaurum TaxID=1795 RepID=UPI002FF872D8